MKDIVSKSTSLFERRKAVVANGVGVFNTATVSTAKGSIIVDVDGKKLIDFAGGIGVVNAGHCPEKVVEAIQKQAEKYIHTSFNVVTYEPYVKLCEELAEIVPHGENTKIMLVTTGAEAVENAIKIARQVTKRQAVLCFTDAFHGRTMMSMTLTSKVDYKKDCGPFAPEVYRLPFPNHYKNGEGKTLNEYVDLEIKRLQDSFKNLVAPSNLAAIIIELVQGEGGFNVVPKRYLEALRSSCDDHGIMLIIDEIQSGFSRTGKWASWQNFDITPDISTYAKSLGSGMPIAAIVGKAEIMDAAAPGTIGGTYIGNPISCVAASATIQLIKDQGLNKRGKNIGNITRKRFENIQKKCPEIGDVRGLGAMMAIEFVKNKDPKQPDAALCARIIKQCFERGLILLSAGTHKNVIRILSPLVISDELLDTGLTILEEEIMKACHS